LQKKSLTQMNLREGLMQVVKTLVLFIYVTCS
jgi:hypothetical protein